MAEEQQNTEGLEGLEEELWFDAEDEISADELTQEEDEAELEPPLLESQFDIKAGKLLAKIIENQMSQFAGRAYKETGQTYSDREIDIIKRLIVRHLRSNEDEVVSLLESNNIAALRNWIYKRAASHMSVRRSYSPGAEVHDLLRSAEKKNYKKVFKQHTKPKPDKITKKQEKALEKAKLKTLEQSLKDTVKYLEKAQALCKKNLKNLPESKPYDGARRDYEKYKEKLNELKETIEYGDRGKTDNQKATFVAKQLAKGYLLRDVAQSLSAFVQSIDRYLDKEEAFKQRYKDLKHKIDGYKGSIGGSPWLSEQVELAEEIEGTVFKQSRSFRKLCILQDAEPSAKTKSIVEGIKSLNWQISRIEQSEEIFEKAAFLEQSRGEIEVYRKRLDDTLEMGRLNIKSAKYLERVEEYIEKKKQFLISVEEAIPVTAWTMKNVNIGYNGFQDIKQGCDVINREALKKVDKVADLVMATSELTEIKKAINNFSELQQKSNQRYGQALMMVNDEVTLTKIEEHVNQATQLLNELPREKKGLIGLSSHEIIDLGVRLAEFKEHLREDNLAIRNAGLTKENMKMSSAQEHVQKLWDKGRFLHGKSLLTMSVEPKLLERTRELWQDAKNLRGELKKVGEQKKIPDSVLTGIKALELRVSYLENQHRTGLQENPVSRGGKRQRVADNTSSRRANKS